MSNADQGLVALLRQAEDPTCWSAHIEIVGRWRRRITLVHDTLPIVAGTGVGWSAWGAAWAEWTARHQLAKKRARLAREAEWRERARVIR